MLYAIKIFDQVDSGALRDIHRKAHLDYLAQFDAATLFAGPFTTDDGSQELGSFRLLDLPDRKTADEHVSGEPFIQEGVQHSPVVHSYDNKASYTWRDCPRTEGNIPMLVFAIDATGVIEKRKELQPAHRKFLQDRADITMMHGPLVQEDGATQVGSAFMFDVPDMETGRAMWAEEPNHKAGVYESVEVYRWRFGRIFDRLKK